MPTDTTPQQLALVPGLKKLPEPFAYDVVNTAREVLAQLSTPMLVSFTSSFNMPTPFPARINETGALFTDLLTDMDRLLETDTVSREVYPASEA